MAGAVNVEQFPGKLPTSDIGAFLDGAIPRFNQTDARAPAFIVRANGVPVLSRFAAGRERTELV